MPDLGWDTIIARTFVLVLVAGVALTGAYLALNPPPVDGVALPASRRTAHRWEWGVPVGVVVALFAGFLVAQATAMWGGHDYLQRTTGLTYAEYVHQGFGQLTVATFLTVVVVALTTRVAARDTARGPAAPARCCSGACACSPSPSSPARCTGCRSTRRPSATRCCGCSSTASSSGWGWSSSSCSSPASGCTGRWVPRAVLVSAAVFALGFAAMNPDAWVAARNIDRFDERAKPRHRPTCRPSVPTRRR